VVPEVFSTGKQQVERMSGNTFMIVVHIVELLGKQDWDFERVWEMNVYNIVRVHKI
jgi:hypothetical protein